MSLTQFTVPNAEHFQVYANTVVKTRCLINTSISPPLVSHFKTIDDSAFGVGPLLDEYILFNGQQIRDFTVEDRIIVKEG